MTILFWLFAFLLVYPLFIYPICLMFLNRNHKYKAVTIQNEKELPYVSILLSAYNEEKVIAQKLNNFLQLDYPKERIEFLVVSDESTDQTDALVQKYAGLDDRIRLLRQENRAGKTKALNRAALEAQGEILFFTDADSMLHKDAMRRLIAPFADSSVGLVSGRSVYLDEQGNETAGSVYRRYEEWLKEREGALWGIAGADGGIYAMRKEHYTELPEKIINDLAHPIQIVLSGKKALAVPEALVGEPPEEDNSVFARQTRIMSQSWLVFFTYFRLLLEKKCYGFLWQFVSHKILRWLALPWLVLFTLSAVYTEGALANLGLIGVFILVVCALVGEKAKTIGRICRLFLAQSAAGINGLFRLWQGDLFVTWNPKGKK